MSRALQVVPPPNALRMDELRRLLKQRPLPGPGWPLDLVPDLAEHLVWMRMKGRADRTLVCRRRAVVLLAEWLGRDPVDATEDELYSYHWHLEVSSSPQNATWQLSLIRPWFGWLHKAGRRPDDPAALLPIGEQPRGLPRPMAEDKLRTVLDGAPARILPWLLMAACCGLRACEIARLRVDDVSVDRGGNAAVYVPGKGGRWRRVPVPGWAWPTVAASIADSGPCWRKVRGFGAVTPSIVSNQSNKHLHALGYTDTLHSLRHRAATVLLRTVRRSGEGDIRTVQEFLGHRSLTTTQIYTQVESEELAHAVNAMPAPTQLPQPDGPRHLHVVDDTAHGGTA